MGKSASIANQSETVPGSCLLSLSLLLAYASAFTTGQYSGKPLHIPFGSSVTSVTAQCAKQDRLVGMNHVS